MYDFSRKNDPFITDKNPDSVAHKQLKAYERTVKLYLFTTIFCAFFGAVYELFSHEVYSYSMIYAFAFPLILGLTPLLVFKRSLITRLYNSSPKIVYNFGVAILTVGSIVNGILDIYGTESGLLKVYWVAGAIAVIAGALMLIFKKTKRSGLAEKTFV